jgi:hypothetical protein
LPDFFAQRLRTAVFGQSGDAQRGIDQKPNADEDDSDAELFPVHQQQSRYSTISFAISFHGVFPMAMVNRPAARRAFAR